MKISTKVKYGLRFLLELSTANEGQVSLGVVAREQGISEKYLWHIARRLRDGGIIVSSRGVEGGFCLARPPREITMFDIYEAVEGGKLSECLEDTSVCGRSPTCLGRMVWNGLESAMTDYMKSLSLEAILHMKSASQRSRK